MVYSMLFMFHCYAQLIYNELTYLSIICIDSTLTNWFSWSMSFPYSRMSTTGTETTSIKASHSWRYVRTLCFTALLVHAVPVSIYSIPFSFISSMLLCSLVPSQHNHLILLLLLFLLFSFIFSSSPPPCLTSPSLALFLANSNRYLLHYPSFGISLFIDPNRVSHASPPITITDIYH